MPELPEVETIIRRLSPVLTNQEICSAELLWEGSLATPSSEEFCHLLPGQLIQKVSRRGKFIWIRLSQYHLLIHLRMSGDLFTRPIEEPIEPHDRVIINLTGGLSLVFNDTRKFGRMWLTIDPGQVLGKLGPEPLADSFNAELFHHMLKEKHRQLKPLLMDQTFLSGLGNIYTDEALHIARLNPLRKSDSLTIKECVALREAIRDVLQEGILRNGSSIDWVYKGGDFQNHFRVYGRKGEACPTCGAMIEKILVGQRGTHFCPVCQLEEK